MKTKNYRFLKPHELIRRTDQWTSAQNLTDPDIEAGFIGIGTGFYSEGPPESWLNQPANRDPLFTFRREIPQRDKHGKFIKSSE